MIHVMIVLNWSNYGHVELALTSLLINTMHCHRDQDVVFVSTFSSEDTTDEYPSNNEEYCAFVAARYIRHSITQTSCNANHFEKIFC
jgi:hypothetical protein